MLDIKERYLTDEQGNRVAVVLDIDSYRQLRLIELESLAASRWRKANGELDLDAIGDADVKHMQAFFATLTEEQVTEAEEGRGPYMWLIDILDELGCIRLLDEAPAETGDSITWDKARAEIEAAWAKHPT